MVRGFVLMHTAMYWFLLGAFFKASQDPSITAVLGPDEISQATLLPLSAGVCDVCGLCVFVAYPHVLPLTLLHPHTVRAHL